MSDRLQQLLDLYLSGTLTESQRVELSSLLEKEDETKAFATLVGQQLTSREFIIPGDLPSTENKLLQEISEKINTGKANTTPVHRVHFIRTAWFKYAAAIIIMFGIGAYLWTTNKKTGQTFSSNNEQRQADISPGGDKAILTLSNGTKITLDNAANGNLAQQGGAQVIKTADGQIVYDAKGALSNELTWNTMSTPIGGQYQVTLPDGTKVWLNAASSITFPAVFTGKKREVKIQGEVYFEVVKNKQKPFFVDVDGKSTVEVLGTSFNINSYSNEDYFKTTLVEGSVKVAVNKPTSRGNQPRSAETPSQQPVILQPGQQASINVKALHDHQSQLNKIQVHAADLDQTLAWKNGLFNFNGADLPTVMRQLERWYDIKVRYEGPVSKITFSGKIYRNVNLSDVLELFQKTGIKFRREGKVLIITS